MQLLGDLVEVKPMKMARIEDEIQSCNVGACIGERRVEIHVTTERPRGVAEDALGARVPVIAT